MRGVWGGGNIWTVIRVNGATYTFTVLFLRLWLTVFSVNLHLISTLFSQQQIEALLHDDIKMMAASNALIHLCLFLQISLNSGTFLEGHPQGQRRRYPHVLVIVADDLGIGDLGCYGNHTMKTPNIDKLAAEGVKLNHHLTASTYCTPSRAALMTSRYATRYGLEGENGTAAVVIHVASQISLPFSETTLAKALAVVNYTTAAVGKWHLGSNCGFFGKGCNGPKKLGFQHFYGILDTLRQEIKEEPSFWIFPLNAPIYQGILGAWLLLMVLLIPAKLTLRWRPLSLIGTGLLFSILLGLPWCILTHYQFHTRRWWETSSWMHKHMNGVLMHNEELIERPLTVDGLTQRLVNYSVNFIVDHAQDDHPFFLYHAFGHVHTPMFTGPGRSGCSKHGRYGDNVEEMDEAVGILMETLKAHGIDGDTLVYFISDHGGHLELIDENGQRVGGYNGLFKGGKGQGGSEGGIRVPGIYRWKDHLPAGISIDTPTSLLDMMPTVLELAGIPPLHELIPNKKHEIDGVSIANLLLQKGKLESRVFIHHCLKSIHALRWVQENHIYKMFLKRHKYPANSTQCGWGYYSYCSCFNVIDVSSQPILFDLTIDPYEDSPISPDTTEYQETTAYLLAYLANWEEKVHYPPSQYRSMWATIHSIWLQPF
ncbi:hypothetical protein SK128_026417 [Halocaridina rubra]|uniref:Sulfatase N-terminal domain-containing protein n=1 Tax=Halocaridina rubra TaxID=373956 RepID=A0AAN8WJM4_HALRR